MAGAGPECTHSLVLAQRECNSGGNGLAEALTAEGVVVWRKGASMPLGSPTSVFSQAPTDERAENNLHLKLGVVCEEIYAARMAHKSSEPGALLYVTKNLAGPALELWMAGLNFAKLTPTASGIGNGSVIYRAILRMLKAYENTNAVYKARADFDKMKWGCTVALTSTAIARVLNEYQIVANRTAALPEVNRLEPLTFNRILVKIRQVCPQWVEERIIANPDDCGTLADVWALLAKHEPRTTTTAPPPRAGPLNMLADFARDPRGFQDFYGPRLPEQDYWRLQAAYSAVDAGDVDMARLLLHDDEDLLGILPLRNEDVADNEPRQTALFALSHALASNGRPITCWRCGDKENPHRLCDCPAPMSAEEKAGAHRSLWPKVQPVRAAFRAGPRPAILPTPPVHQLSVPDANLGAQMVAMRQDFDRFQAVIMQLVSPAAAAMGAPVLQLAVAPTPASTNDVARVCCAPRGGSAPAGHRHVAQDETFDWFAPAGASDEAINQAFQQWPGSGN